MQHPSLNYFAALCLIVLALMGLGSAGMNYVKTQTVLNSVYDVIKAPATLVP
jgi:hypothetical protein